VELDSLSPSQPVATGDYVFRPVVWSIRPMAKSEKKSDPDKPAKAAKPSKSDATTDNGDNDSGRRSFLERATAIAVGVVISVTPLVVGLFAFLDPLKPKKRATALGSAGEGDPAAEESTGPGRWLKVGSLADVPTDGTPQAFPVIADTWDAWNYYPPHPIGSVYIRIPAEGEKPIAWTATCPHLGCFVEFSKAKECFSCPCHNSKFGLDGQRIEGPPPRGMDELELEIRQGDEVWVRYEKFRAGEAHKVPE
jgi:menaquinol-cytochrome c reductase iron-sulfur subunit